MLFESEVLPLFAGGVVLVSLLELAIGCKFFRGKKTAQGLFALHIASMLVGFGLLGRMLFHTGQADSVSNSFSIGLFGICWFFSVIFMLASIHESTQ